ncbi:MAG TPA: Ig domain-containing protein, partial [Oleiagrimonas sp.]|nr:Ig domain-containing protein [Oleiagrimonas sp.]
MSRRIVLLDIGNALTLRGVLPSIALHASYSAKVTASGGTAPYSYAVVNGALPAGMTLDVTTGTLSAADVTQAGRFAIVIEATDVTGATIRRSFVITVRDEAPPPTPSLVISGEYPDAVAGRSYSAGLTISGGSPPYANPQVTSGSLPTGLALSVSGNQLVLSGTATTQAIGSYQFTVGVDDATAAHADSGQQSMQVVAETNLYGCQVWMPDREVYDDSNHYVSACDGSSDQFGFAVDPATRQIWVRAVDGTWCGGGDPVAGTGETYIMPGSDTLYFGARPFRANSTVVIVDPSSYALSPPQGFVAPSDPRWDPNNAHPAIVLNNGNRTAKTTDSGAYATVLTQQPITAKT